MFSLFQLTLKGQRGRPDDRRCTTKKKNAAKMSSSEMPGENANHDRDEVAVDRHQISRHMDRLACLRMRRRRLSRLRRRVWVEDDVE